MRIFFIFFCFIAMSSLVADEFSIDVINETNFNESILWEKLIQQDDLVYKNGFLFTGSANDYYENGKIKFLKSYKNGMIDGYDYTWYKSGQKKSEFYFLKSEKHGTCITWYNNGQMQLYAQYSYGKINGIFKAWDEDGTLHFEMFHVESDSDSERIQEEERDSTTDSDKSD
ncbi:MAG: hypothetical protein K8S23_01820 [Candidatus Cloacimonetes bacterium]|nr:hypothetical protein [Candidatus Cloacimonadota bacterium]